MIRDPFGGWDWDGIKQFGFMILVFVLLFSFGASTSGRWFDPWTWVGNFILTNSTFFLILSMVSLLGFFWHERFMGGLH
mgnify:CR=1 FL=1